MNQLSEVELSNTLDTLRHCVSGRSFAEDPETFKNIEPTKVRLNILRDPKHYEKQHAEYDAKRSARRALRGSAQ